MTKTAGRIVIHVQPGAKQNEIVGRHGDAIRIRLHARPVDGAANAALLAFMAGALGISRQNVEIVSGYTSRRKTLAVHGMANHEVEAMLLSPGTR